MTIDLLSIIQDVCDELSLPEPSAVVTSTDQTMKTMLRLANREGRWLVRAHHWTVLQRLHTITTVINQAEYALPDDYSRLVPDTEWDQTNLTPLIGPMDGVDWRTIKSGGIGSGVVGRRFRIMRGSSTPTRKVYIDPTPTVAGDSLSFEYVSTSFCTAVDGTTLQDAFAADTDLVLLNDDLFRAGTLLRYRRSRGLIFASEADEYMMMLADIKGQDRPARTLNLEQRSVVPRYLNLDNVPETGFGN